MDLQKGAPELWYCHCGELVYIHDEPPGFTRMLCWECDSVRCDAPTYGAFYECYGRPDLTELLNEWLNHGD